MSNNKVTLKISELLNALDQGLTWLASEDAGHGNIQSIIGATDEQIEGIKQHPKLQGVEPRTIIIFEIVDDTDEVVTAEVDLSSEDNAFQVEDDVENPTAAEAPDEEIISQEPKGSQVITDAGLPPLGTLPEPSNPFVDSVPLDQAISADVNTNFLNTL